MEVLRPENPKQAGVAGSEVMLSENNANLYPVSILGTMPPSMTATTVARELVWAG